MEWLSEELRFPDYEATSNDGIIAIGGDLGLERLQLAYAKGIFPWYNEDSPILWWFPDPRFVLFPEELRISKSMKKILNDQIFTFTENKCFEEVISSCQRKVRHGQEGTWISGEMKEAYIGLHKKDCQECRNMERKRTRRRILRNRRKAFFLRRKHVHNISNASKAGFIHFVQKYQTKYELIDCQVHTSHLESLGAKEIPAKTFIKYLK